MVELAPQTLFIYSNPSDSERLWLDKEHRAIDDLLAKLRLSADRIHRLHAADLRSIAAAVQSNRYRFMHFSGHGTAGGIFLEAPAGEQGVVVNTQDVKAILHLLAPDLLGAVFLSCHSSGMIEDLSPAVPYLIAVDGEADDAAAIEFVEQLYAGLFQGRDVETAFHNAGMLAASDLRPILVRRTDMSASPDFLCVFVPESQMRLGRRFYFNITRAMDSIRRLGLDIGLFSSMISRKVRYHMGVFAYSRQRLFFPVGTHFCTLSWDNADDVIYCEEVFRLTEDAPIEICADWTELIYQYALLSASPYRDANFLNSGFSSKRLQGSLRILEALFERYFDGGETARRFAAQYPQAFKVCYALARANIRMARQSFEADAPGDCIVYMEAVLSSTHDFIDAVAREILE